MATKKIIIATLGLAKPTSSTYQTTKMEEKWHGRLTS
jgi:hypothetical protein